MTFRFIDVSEDKLLWHLKGIQMSEPSRCLKSHWFVIVFYHSYLEHNGLCTRKSWVTEIVTLQIWIFIKNFLFLNTPPICTFWGALIKHCRSAIAHTLLASSCCCQVTPAKFCNMSCSGFLLTELWRTAAWVTWLPHFKLLGIFF